MSLHKLNNQRKTTKSSKQVVRSNDLARTWGSPSKCLTFKANTWAIFYRSTRKLDVSQRVDYSRKAVSIHGVWSSERSQNTVTTTTNESVDSIQVSNEQGNMHTTAFGANDDINMETNMDISLNKKRIIETDITEDFTETINPLEEFDDSTGALDDPNLYTQLLLEDQNNIINLFRVNREVRGCGVKMVAAISDIRLQSPVYPEVTELLQRKRGELPKLIQMTMFFDKYYEIREEFKSVWNIIIDLFRTVILYGYQIEKDDLRNRMVKVWLSWSYKTATLDTTKEFFNVKFTTSRWCKVVKYKLAAFAAYAKCDDDKIYPKNPLTVEDNPAIIIDRKFSQWFNSLPNISIIDKLGRMSLVDSICRGVKKGADRASEDDCFVNQIETFQLLTTRKPIPLIVVLDAHEEVSVPGHNTKYLKMRSEPVCLTQPYIKSEIERSVIEILDGISPFNMQYNISPSFASSTNSSRQAGGHMAEIRGIPQFKKEKSDLQSEVEHIFLSDPIPITFGNETDQIDPLCSSPLLSSDPDFLGAKQHGECRSTIGLCFTEPSCLGTDLDIDELCKLCLSSSSNMRCVALKEALKVRGITTPEALETWLLKPLQKHLSKHLSTYDVFKVTSTPLTVEHIKKVFSKILPGQSVISGDYDNATNMLLGRYTRTCITQICKSLGLSNLYSEVAIRSLCDNVVNCSITKNYDNTNYKIDLSDTQKEAQPMGKVLSFVVLCMINFAVCRLAYEIDSGKNCVIRKFPGLINGDDVFFPIRKVKTWESCSAMVGLNNSIGKTFISKPGTDSKSCKFFIEMNSRSFIVDTKNPNNLEFFEVPFINFGLMKGLVRSENTADSAVISKQANAIAKMGACHSELTKGFDKVYDELDYLFRGYHSDVLKSDLIRGIPFYIPKWLGGLGLYAGPRYYERIPEIHRKAASVLFSNYDEFKKRPQSIVDAKTCMIDDIITRDMRAALRECNAPEEVHHLKLEASDGNIYDLKDQNIKIYSKLVEEVWRTNWEEEFFIKHKNKKEKTEFQNLSEKALLRKLRHNSKLWTSAHAVALNTKVEPLPYHKLWHRKFDSYWPVYMKDANLINQQRNELILDTINRKIDFSETLYLLPDIYDYISHLVRLLRLQDMIDDFKVFRNQTELYRKILVQNHGMVWVGELLCLKDIVYKNPFLSGLTSFSNLGQPSSYYLEIELNHYYRRANFINSLTGFNWI